MRPVYYKFKAVIGRLKNFRNFKKTRNAIPSQGIAPTLESKKGNDYFTGKSFLLLTHELSYTGAPLLLMETAQMLMKEGAVVKLVNPYRGRKWWSLRIKRLAVARDHHVPILPFRLVFRQLETADFIIANTVSKQVMAVVDELLEQVPKVAEKLVIWVHEIDVERYSPSTNNIKRAALIIFDSHACKDAWESCLGPLKNAVVVHPALSPQMLHKLSQDRSEFPHVPTSRNAKNTYYASRDEIRAVLDVDDNDFLVLCLGTVENRKGQALLLDTLSKINSECERPIKLCLVGFKNARKRRHFIKNMSDTERAILAPERAYVWQSEIAGFYIAADAFVMNSQGENNGRGECFGRVTVEAMAAGSIALGTSVGGTKEIIKHEVNGYLFPAGVEGQAILADQVKYLSGNSEVVEALSADARKYAVQVFDQKIFLKKFEDLFAKSFHND